MLVVPPSHLSHAQAEGRVIDLCVWEDNVG